MEKKITLIIPIFNEIKGIKKSILNINKFSENFFDWNIIVVDDGSNDGTSEILNEKLKNKIKIISHEVNKGYGAALKSGIKATLSDYIAIIDADGTYPFEDFKKFEEEMEKYSMVIGYRKNIDGSIPLIKRIPKFFIRKFASYITGINILDFNSGMRIFKRKYAMKLMNYFPNGFSFTTTITVSFASNDLEVKYLPIEYLKRDGKSKIKPIRDTIKFLLLIFRLGIYFSPFKIYGPLIIISTLVGIGFMSFRIYNGEGFLALTLISFMLSIVFTCFAMLAHSISLIFRDRLSND